MGPTRVWDLCKCSGRWCDSVCNCRIADLENLRREILQSLARVWQQEGTERVFVLCCLLATLEDLPRLISFLDVGNGTTAVLGA